jgi:hypothetical protein
MQIQNFAKMGIKTRNDSENTNLKSTETEKIAVIDYCHGAVSDVEDWV